MAKIGIIGGTGLDDEKGFDFEKETEVATPYGNPSGKIKEGKIGGKDVAILFRHGPGHSIMPSNVNFRANIWALKEVGCTHILASTACGSLREEIEPGHIVFPDQFIDRTTKRASTFYEQEKVCHIGMAEPFCTQLRRLLEGEAKNMGIKYHSDKTMITIEGPRFSTKAESRMFRQWGADVINMSTVPEVVLAREAGICYQAIAMSTDYDCFRDDVEPVIWEEIVKVMKKNAENTKKLIQAAAVKIGDWDCGCKEAIKSAVL